ncbi:MAG TPA: PIN domain-containing protein [Pyrinomonadaceae bacterium]|nr:PIN domain-containing protein [Pyrinomonadaceae bacterium]
MSSPAWLNIDRALADTGVFILWYRGEPKAKLFFRNPNIEIYYSRVTRKELLRSPISDAERRQISLMLGSLRQINPDKTVTDAYTELLHRYPNLRHHLADALIAASAWAKSLPLVTINLRHFKSIKEIEVIPF